MYFSHYEYFIAIVECGSLTKAAERLFVSQPSLSQYVKRLEKSLGVELFDHTTSPLRLTFTGERYYQYVRQLVKLNEAVRKEFQDISNQESGYLRLGVALWRGACLLPDVFPRFHANYPNIRLRLEEGQSDFLEQKLMNDKIDLAIMNLPKTLNYSKLAIDVICEERIMLAASLSHPYVQELLTHCTYQDGYPVAPLDLLRHVPLIITKPGQNLTHELNHLFGKNQVEPNILMETGNLTTAINLCAQGCGCVFVPEEGAKICQHPGQLQYFTVDVPDLHWPLAAVYRKDTYLPHIPQLFIGSVKEQLQGMQTAPTPSC